MISPDRRQFARLAERGNAIPLVRRLLCDQLTPVLGYRRLVSADEREAPSFLLESVEGGATVGRYSVFGARPDVEVLARGRQVTVLDHRAGEESRFEDENPLMVPRRLSAAWRTPGDREWPEAAAFGGGWVGYGGYDTVRYLEPEKIPFAAAPTDDRGLPEMHFGFYRRVCVVDHVSKLLYAICYVMTDEHASIDEAYDAGVRELDELVVQLETHSVPLPAGAVDLDVSARSAARMSANFTRDDFERAVARVKEYIAAGDAFQIVLSQRFERRTTADPFEVYRALRVVNPSPYMIYLQASGSILVASSPEILCRCHGGTVTSRPLAGTRPRGRTPEEDIALETELRGDEKERAEHIMLVDLGRNDLGRICRAASVQIERALEVERYSHVMHLSSTVSGALRDGLDCWDALQATLPVGTVSGAPKVRAMQIIDELEPTRRGPYAGGIGYVTLEGDMDVAIALRTLVIPTAARRPDGWTVHLQAGAGIVADSDPAREYEETVSKVAGLGRAIDLAEHAFGA